VNTSIRHGAKRAHASHTNDLNGQVLPLVSIQQDAALVGQRLPVTRKSVGHPGLELRAGLLAQVINQGRIIPDRRLPVFHTDELGEIYFEHVARFGLLYAPLEAFLGLPGP